MKANVGTADKKIRSFVIAPLAIILAFVVGPGSVLGIILFVVAVVMWLTSLVSFCPIWGACGVNTTKSH